MHHHAQNGPSRPRQVTGQANNASVKVVTTGTKYFVTEGIDDVQVLTADVIVVLEGSPRAGRAVKVDASGGTATVWLAPDGSLTDTVSQGTSKLYTFAGRRQWNVLA